MSAECLQHCALLKKIVADKVVSFVYQEDDTWPPLSTYMRKGLECPYTPNKNTDFSKLECPLDIKD